jgi:4a-hydroxytetrahydrobiopterin dehydratase
VSENWKTKRRPPSLEARFEFEDYDLMRDFLDDIADVTEQMEHHPNISFGRTHVSIVIYPKSGDALDEIDHQLAQNIDKCFEKIDQPA